VPTSSFGPGSNLVQFVFGTAIVIFATYLYSGSERKRKRPPPINIASYEKTTIDNGYTPRDEGKQLQLPPGAMDSIKSAGLSTSRPGSPMGQRHHSRAPSSRGKIRRDD